MASQQPPGDPKPLIMDSHQPPASSQTIKFHWKSAQMTSQQPPGESKPSIMASQQLPGDSKNCDISFEKICKWFHNSLLEISNHESADSSGARACGTPDKASNPASNLSEPTCKAATTVEVSPAKPKPTTSPKLKPAASIEQFSNGAIDANLHIEPSKLQRFDMGPPEGRCIPCKLMTLLISKNHKNITQIFVCHCITTEMTSQQPPGN